MENKAMEWLQRELNLIEENKYTSYIELKLKKAIEIDNKEKIKYQLFIGKVAEIFGLEKTIELLKECKNEIL